jgi:hypothetical protein
LDRLPSQLDDLIGSSTHAEADGDIARVVGTSRYLSEGNPGG